MTQACCPSCRLRFTRDLSAYIALCPECAAPLDDGPARDLLGYRLYAASDPIPALPMAVAAALAPPERAAAVPLRPLSPL